MLKSCIAGASLAVDLLIMGLSQGISQLRLYILDICLEFLRGFLRGFLFRGNKVAHDYEEINESIKSMLSKYFLSHNRSLSQFLKKDLDHCND